MLSSQIVSFSQFLTKGVVLACNKKMDLVKPVTNEDRKINLVFFDIRCPQVNGFAYYDDVCGSCDRELLYEER